MGAGPVAPHAGPNAEGPRHPPLFPLPEPAPHTGPHPIIGAKRICECAAVCWPAWYSTNAIAVLHRTCGRSSYMDVMDVWVGVGASSLPDVSGSVPVPTDDALAGGPRRTPGR